MEHKLGSEVTLWDELVYDSSLTISTDDVAEVIGYAPDDDRIIIAFQDLIDEEGTTPTVWVDPVEVERPSECVECGGTLYPDDRDYGAFCSSCG